MVFAITCIRWNSRDCPDCADIVQERMTRERMAISHNCNRLLLPPLGRVGQFGQDTLHALDDNLLLLQLVESGFAAKFGSERNRTTKRELANHFALQERPGSQTSCSSYAAGSYLIALRDVFLRSRLRLA